jgi:hypothetical protein
MGGRQQRLLAAIAIRSEGQVLQSHIVVVDLSTRASRVRDDNIHC